MKEKEKSRVDYIMILLEAETDERMGKEGDRIRILNTVYHDVGKRVMKLMDEWQKIHPKEKKKK